MTTITPRPAANSTRPAATHARKAENLGGHAATRARKAANPASQAVGPARSAAKAPRVFAKKASPPVTDKDARRSPVNVTMYLDLCGAPAEMLEAFNRRPPLKGRQITEAQHVYVQFDLELLAPEAAAALRSELERAWDALTAAQLSAKGVGWALCPVDALYATCKKGSCTGLHLRQAGCLSTDDCGAQIVAGTVAAALEALGLDRQLPAWKALAAVLPATAVVGTEREGTTFYETHYARTLAVHVLGFSSAI